MARDESPSLKQIVSRVRGCRGIGRKRAIELTGKLLPGPAPEIIAARGEDGAVIAANGSSIVFAADGIMEELIEKDSHWAGYCSVLANVNDLVSMRSRPLAAVNVISAVDQRALVDIIDGIAEACEKYRVNMVGGHLHPEASANGIAVAMIGLCGEDGPLLSSSASAGESVLIISDCSGSFTPGIPYSWDCTSTRNAEEMAERIDAVLSAFSHFTAAKDISNPGLLGTLAMLLESSGMGSEISVPDIPVPTGVDLLPWLEAYQGFGFVGTAPSTEFEKIIDDLSGIDITVSEIGRVTGDKKLILKAGGERELLFDLATEKITGLY